MASSVVTADAVAPMRQRQNLEFPYKHSTGETVGRFLAGLKEQKKIWGQRVAKQGVVVPPLGYSEVDASNAGAWVAVKETGVITAVARVDHPIARLHPSTTPFAFVLVKLDGADTAMAHIVSDDLDRARVGARVQAVWKADDARVGSIRDIECFRVIADPAQPKPQPKATGKTSQKQVSKRTKRTKATSTAKSTKAAKTARSPSPPLRGGEVKKPKKAVRGKKVASKSRTKMRATSKPKRTTARKTSSKRARKKK